MEPGGFELDRVRHLGQSALNLATLQRRLHVSDRAGLDELHVGVRVQPGFLQGHAAGDVESGARVGDGDRLTLEISRRLDGRLRLHEVGIDGHQIGHDDDVGAIGRAADDLGPAA